jgi:sigma-E factor negative regulatory protein RseB
MPSGWRVAGLAAILGLLGSAVAGLALAERSAGPAAVWRSALASGIAGTGSLRLAQHNAGLRLLEQAAAACQATSYSGEQAVLWWGPGETSASVVDVWHEPGRATLVQAASAAPGSGSGALPGVAGPNGAAIRGSGAADQDPDGILGVSDQLLALLESNYQVVYAGRGSAAGRPALVVEVRRPRGGLAARFWLDAATKLPLQRQLFDQGAQLVSEDAFINLELGTRAVTAMPAPARAPWTARLDQASVMALRAKGWPLPGELPGNLALFAATETRSGSGPVVDLSYSDGLAVISVFVQRGELGTPMPGWRQIGLGGQTVYSINPDERSFAWSSGGFVYTVVADAPVATVSQVVAAMPSSRAPGFWKRMAIGFRRLGSWLNPLH